MQADGKRDGLAYFGRAPLVFPENLEARMPWTSRAKIRLVWTQDATVLKVVYFRGEGGKSSQRAAD
jgi:hypothetical protein